MTRKDYVLVAGRVNKAYRDAFALLGSDSTAVTRVANSQLDGIRATAMALCDGLSDDNPRFDRVRFIEACLDTR